MQEKKAEAKSAYDEAERLAALGTGEALFEAVRHYERALRLAAECGASEIEESSRSLLGYSVTADLYLLGDKLCEAETDASRREAITYFSETLRLASAYGDGAWVDSALGSLGDAHAALAEHDVALGFYRRKLEIERGQESAAGEATTLSAMADCYKALGQARAAADHSLLAAEVYTKLAEPLFESIHYAEAAESYLSAGERQKALELFLKQLDVLRRLRDKDREADVLNTIGILYFRSGDKQKSLEHLEESLRLFRESGGDDSTVAANLARVKKSVPDFRELYEQLMSYEGERPYEDVLLAWGGKAADAMSVLGAYGEEGAKLLGGDDIIEHLWDFYALSRVSDVLLLPFQRGEYDGSPWRGPAITPEQREEFFLSLGMRKVGRFELTSPTTFHPFYHEVVEVVQSPDAAEPLSLDGVLWSGFMLGSMMFCRAGVRVRGGRDHINKEVAEVSTLYFAYRRKSRPTSDLSVGWGSNSQWRTRFRRDYLDDTAFYYNVDEGVDVGAPHAADEGVTSMKDLAPAERIELVRNRCFILSEKPHDSQFPYAATYTEKREAAPVKRGLFARLMKGGRRLG